MSPSILKYVLARPCTIDEQAEMRQKRKNRVREKAEEKKREKEKREQKERHREGEREGKTFTSLSSLR